MTWGLGTEGQGVRAEAAWDACCGESLFFLCEARMLHLGLCVPAPIPAPHNRELMTPPQELVQGWGGESSHREAFQGSPRQSSLVVLHKVLLCVTEQNRVKSCICKIQIIVRVFILQNREEAYCQKVKGKEIELPSVAIRKIANDK